MSYSNFPQQIGSEEVTSARRTARMVKTERALSQVAAVEPVSEAPSGAFRDAVPEPTA